MNQIFNSNFLVILFVGKNPWISNIGMSQATFFCSLQRYKMPTFKLVSAAPRFEITFHNGRDHYDNVMSLILRFSSFDVFLVMQVLSFSLLPRKLKMNGEIV